MYKWYTLFCIMIFSLGFNGDGHKPIRTARGQEAMHTTCNQRINWDLILTGEFMSEIDDIIDEHLQINSAEWDVPHEYLDDQTGLLTFTSKTGDVSFYVLPMVNEEHVRGLVKNEIRSAAGTYRQHFYLTLVWLCGDNEFPKFGLASSLEFLIPPEETVMVQPRVIYIPSTDPPPPIRKKVAETE